MRSLLSLLGGVPKEVWWAAALLWVVARLLSDIGFGFGAVGGLIQPAE